MLKLIEIAVWIVIIAIFAGGIICVIAEIKEGGGHIAIGIFSLIAGVIAFVVVYNWLESIPFCLFVSGGVMVAICTGGGDRASSSGKKNTESTSFGQAYLDSYCEYELTKAAVKDAIRESKK